MKVKEKREGEIKEKRKKRPASYKINRPILPLNVDFNYFTKSHNR
jgi:hypothetical protein